MNEDGGAATARRLVRDLCGFRAEADDRVGSRADIIGSMVGIKVRGGALTPSIGLTYFVRRKVPADDLPPRSRVPKRLSFRDGHVLTDVLEWPVMAEQDLSSAEITYDGRLQGTLTCFGKSSNGIFGVSCAHCLTGIDGNPATATPVDMYSKSERRYLRAGSSVFAVFSPGPGMPNNYGYADCGLFDLNEATLRARGAASAAIALVRDEKSLVGRVLVGRSALSVSGFPEPMRKATVIGVNANALDERCDLVLECDPPGTFRGDSGMLWLTEDGRAAAIHARGEVAAPVRGSRLVTAMSARRAANFLGVQFATG